MAQKRMEKIASKGRSKRIHPIQLRDDNMNIFVQVYSTELQGRNQKYLKKGGLEFVPAVDNHTSNVVPLQGTGTVLYSVTLSRYRY